MKLSDLKAGDLVYRNTQHNTIEYRIIEYIDLKEQKWHCYYFENSIDSNVPLVTNFYNQNGYPYGILDNLYPISKTEFLKAMLRTVFNAEPKIGHLNTGIIDYILRTMER
jgi:hypothetical protein